VAFLENNHRNRMKLDAQREHKSSCVVMLYMLLNVNCTFSNV